MLRYFAMREAARHYCFLLFSNIGGAPHSHLPVRQSKRAMRRSIISSRHLLRQPKQSRANPAMMMNCNRSLIGVAPRYSSRQGTCSSWTTAAGSGVRA